MAPNGNDKVAKAVDGVRSELANLKNEVATVGAATQHILKCLVNGPDTPDLLTEAIEPTAAEQDFQTNTLRLTLTCGKGAQERDVEVVFEGLDAAEKQSTSPKGDEVKLTFGLPEPWRKAPAPRFVTVNIIDAIKNPQSPTKRRILPATSPKNDEDDD